MSETHATTTSPATGTRELAVRGATALALALAVNYAVTLVASVAGVAPDLAQLSYGPVTLFTTVGVVGATLTYGVLERYADDPDRAFAIVAVVVLAVSVIPDFTFIPSEPGGTLAGGGVLAAMHVTTAAVCVGVLTDLRERY